MTTDEQSGTDRQNTKGPTGPTSENGKNIVRYNALKHGLRAQTVVLPNEDPQAFEELRQGLRDYHQPAGAQECHLVDLIAGYAWRLERAARIEVEVLDLHRRELSDQHVSQLAESPEADALGPAVEDAQRDFRLATAKRVMIEAELRSRKPAGGDTNDEDPVRPGRKDPTEAGVRERLETALEQAISDGAEAANRLGALAAIQARNAARNAELAVNGASVGEAFVADAAGPDALQKLARYERTLMNNQQTALRELKELQDGRVEQAANSA